MFLILLLSLLNAAAAQTALYVPFLYVTPQPIDNEFAGTETQFFAPLCDNSFYDGKQAEFSFNLPFAKWNPSSQQIVNVKVFNKSDCSGDPIATNDVDGSPVQKFTLTYNASMGDLYICATSGGAPNIVYTFSISFSSSIIKDVAKSIDALTFKPSVMGGGTKAITMLQIVSGSGSYKVVTQQMILLNFTYCPTTQAYTLTVTTTALDNHSATALYICTKESEMPCNAKNANYLDPSGSAISSVTMNASMQELTSAPV
jgi:hypothetical protein